MKGYKVKSKQYKVDIKGLNRMLRAIFVDGCQCAFCRRNRARIIRLKRKENHKLISLV